MKKIIFTDDELDILKALIDFRLVNNNELGFENSDKYSIAVHTANEKIANNELGFYNPYEKTMFCSVVNEYFPKFRKELKLATPLSWLTATDKQKQVIYKLDSCVSILEKCGFYGKSKTFMHNHNRGSRYADKLNFLDKLKKSEGILLSKTGKNDYYKIAFIYDNIEYVQFELKRPISIHDDGFTPFSASIKSRFNVEMKRKHEARELLSACEESDYPFAVLEFIVTALN